MSARNSDLNALNPYLHGPYAPVREEVSIDQLQVKGEIPKDFAGAYYRNGPNPKKTPSGMHHWFDGDGMVHAIFFEDGKAQGQGEGGCEGRGLRREDQSIMGLPQHHTVCISFMGPDIVL